VLKEPNAVSKVGVITLRFANKKITILLYKLNPSTLDLQEGVKDSLPRHNIGIEAQFYNTCAISLDDRVSILTKLIPDIHIDNDKS